MSRKLLKVLSIVLGLVVLSVIHETATVNAKTLDVFGATTIADLPNEYIAPYSQNNIMFVNPCEGGINSNITAEGCFKIDSSTEASAFWYGEGCLNTGDCTIGKYYASGQPAGSDNGLVATKNNPFIYNDTKTDNDFGGMQYIYAENYDYNYDGAYTIMTPNGGSSNRKYYWVVLPDQAYTNGFGDTYVATFEKLSDPVYFIVFDSHACPHQSENYCDKAGADPDGVKAGREFLGAFSKNGGAFQEVVSKAGKLTSLCRINGSGEVTASTNTSNVTLKTLSPGSTSDSSNVSGTSTTSGKTVAEKIWNWFVKANIPGLSDNPAAIAGIIGAFATEAGADTIEGLNPFSWSDLGGTLLGCMQSSTCGTIKQDVTNAVGKDYFAYKSGVDGIPEEAVDKAIDLELNFIINSYPPYNPGYSWKTFIENLDVVSNKTPEAYAELFEVMVQNAKGSVPVEDPGILNWIKNHPGYSASQQALDKKRKAARDAYDQLAGAGDSCTTYEGDYPQYVQETPDTCGAASMAMLATVAAGQDISEADVLNATTVQYYNTGGSGMVEQDKLVGEKYGFTVERVDTKSPEDAAAKMKEYLDKGYMIHTSGCTITWSPNGGCHYVGMFKINGNQVLLADSAGGSRPNREVDLFDFVTHGYNKDAFSAIKGSGTKNTCGDNGCNVGSSSINTLAGLTEEQAQKIADYYNHNYTPLGCCGLKNCVEFSSFFVSELTAKGTPGRKIVRGNGDQTVSNLVADGIAKSGDEPKIWSVFSKINGQHTGVVVGANDDGTYITVEAAFPSWIDGYTDGNGNGRVWPNKSFADGIYKFAYFENDLNTNKINEILNQ